MLIMSIITMILALACYSIGVWGEKLSKRLTKQNLMFFWIGFIFDTTGTTMMSLMSDKFTFDIHGITGTLAILLMLFHATWATIVLVKKNTAQIIKFHKFSLFVWMIWLIPFMTGMVLKMI
ncbi:TIGR03987 family protein [Dethiosulfatibacter aminovorans DSM 17477]|uniref:TIGR03987 family protein n=1 Tax=Dethiosulfatibacter aminovorans DSM 17477 TaxID=1121476 RepID=A0A1M6JQ03_9FIRM|nr:HsmA family protein [Dethiosulfatibacter aminovorans]SHJ48750.1 TIGR03987 family protein [Dethiosulfatibacter aminovorans DSM 17477]